MRFLDERHLWYYDTEMLADSLANKSLREVRTILDKHDVIALRSGKRPKLKLINRLAFVVLFLPLVFIVTIKWAITGDMYLDSLAKRSRVLNAVLRFTGISKR